MFEKKLTETFQKIFDVKKVTLLMPSDANEQDFIFIEIEQPQIRFKDGIQRAKVAGKAYIFGRGEKIPFGFLQKQIARAPYDLTKDLFFFNVDANTRTYVDVVQRSFEFVFFFSSQYDPEIGTLNEVTFEVQT